jgi:hypothetical protein
MLIYWVKTVTPQKFAETLWTLVQRLRQTTDDMTYMFMSRHQNGKLTPWSTVLLEKLVVTQLIECMCPEGSLKFSQEDASGAYLNSHPHIVFLQDPL